MCTLRHTVRALLGHRNHCDFALVQRPHRCSVHIGRFFRGRYCGARDFARLLQRSRLACLYRYRCSFAFVEITPLSHACIRTTPLFRYHSCFAREVLRGKRSERYLPSQITSLGSRRIPDLILSDVLRGPTRSHSIRSSRIHTACSKRAMGRCTFGVGSSLF